MAEQMLTANEVCEQFQISRPTLRRWIALGAFPRPLRINGSLRFRPGDVEAFVQSGGIVQRTPLSASFWGPSQSDVAEQLASDAELDSTPHELLAELAEQSKDLLDELAKQCEAAQQGG